MIDPAALRPHYARFLSQDRVLLTGHSHQAWPDVAREGVIEAFDDAATHTDDKWARAEVKANAVRDGVAERLNAQRDEVALGISTHELVTRFLSALPFQKRRHLVATAGEFHSLDRQLRRLSEVGVQVTFVDVAPLETLAERLAAALRDDTAALMASSVLYETSSIVPHLPQAAEAAAKKGAEVLIDAYHSLNIVPFDLSAYGTPVFVTGGGYKYAQWGEANAFLRVPPDSTLRPVLTGWFSDFEHLDAPRGAGVSYGPRPADWYAGSTYDPTCHYRAARVIEFFRQQRLDVAALRALSLRQTARLLAGLDGYEILTPREDARRGGFVSVRRTDATALVRRLRERGVWVDARGSVLRLGPAPYLTDDDLDRGVAMLRELSPP